ncbi:MAG: hypothetical protein ABSH42_00260 [Bryobacteraceae bacterium]
MKRIGLVLALLWCCRLPAADTYTPPVAQKFLAMFQDFRDARAQRVSHPRHVSFTLSDEEINEYMRYALRAVPRPGLDSVSFKIFPQNYVSTFTVIDFDAIERWRPGTIPALLRPILRGKQSIWVDYRFAATNSTISLTVQKAYYDKIWLPALFVEKVIQIVAARQPEHYDTSKPMPLPFGIRQAWTENHIVKGNN